MSQPLGDDSRLRRAEEKVERLQNQINWITQLAIALNSVSNLDDVIAITLAGIMSPTGLSYSQVLYFEHDPELHQLKGVYALYHEDRAAIEALAAELEEEARAISAMQARIAASDQEVGRNSPLTETNLHHLSANSQWVTLFQRLYSDNARTEKLQHLRFSTLRRKKEGNTPRPMLEEVTQWPAPRVMCKSLDGPRLPHAITSMLPEHFLVAPLHGRGRLRGLLILDKHLGQQGPPSSADVNELCWFLRQASLAIDHVEVNTRLTEAYEEMKELEHLKSNFLSTISHELRTPLTSMMGFIDLILQERVGPINDNQRQLLSRVARNNAHLNQLVNDLLELAEIEAIGKEDVQLRPVDPLTIVMDAIQRVETRRNNQGVQVQPIVEQILPKIHTDEKVAERILVHLIDNAVKFSPSKGQVEIRFRIVDQHLAIDIVDHGPGIEQRRLRDIFKTFYQVDSSLTRGHEGLGIGLTVVRMLLQVLGCQIEVESDLGRGSTFSPLFPLEPT